MFVRQMVLASGILAALVFAGTGCGYRDRNAAKETAQAFTKALEQGDGPAFEATLTERARSAMGSMRTEGSLPRKEFTEFEISDPEIKEDQAQVSVLPIQNKDGLTGKDTRMTIHMRRENGEWRVYSFAFPLTSGGEEITFNCEDPQAYSAALFEQQATSIGKGLQALGEGLGKGVHSFFQGVTEGLSASDKGAPSSKK